MKTSKQEKPAKLTYEQMDTLARRIAYDLASVETETAEPLMLLMREIATHPFDLSYVETIANLMTSYLWMWQGASDEEKHAYIEAYRQRFLGGAR